MANSRYGGGDEHAAIESVNRAIDLGVTLFDSAPIYGTEGLLGRALRGRRDEVVLVSKVGSTMDLVSRTEKQDLRYSSIRRMVYDTLRDLDTDHVDVLLLHWPDPETPIDESMQALDDLRSEGLTRYVGVSNHNSYELRQCAKLTSVCVNQVGYNLFDRRWEYEVFPTATELGIGIMAYGPLAHGLLSGALSRGDSFDVTDWRSSNDIFGQQLFGSNLDANLRVVARLGEVAASVGLTTPQLALAWVLSNGMVTVALVGCRTPAEIEANVRAMEIKLDDDILSRIETIMMDAKGRTDIIPGRHHQSR